MGDKRATCIDGLGRTKVGKAKNEVQNKVVAGCIIGA
jgi:hypothetical protein